MIQPSEEPNTTGLHDQARTRIVFRDASYSYRRGPAVVGFKWEVPSHTISALLGRSAAGKSTILALAAGVLAPSAGSIQVDGQDPRQPKTRRLIGFMPQLGGLYGDLSVEENLAVFAAGIGAGEAAIEQTLELMQLKQRRGDIVRELAAGHQQRVSLGAALVGEPSFILLDEPLAYADGEFAGRIWKHLESLAALGRTIVLATSRLDMASRAGLVGIVRSGRLVTSRPLAHLAPTGEGTVVLTYKEKTGPRRQAVPVANYRQEITGLVSKEGTKPFDVEVQQETLEQRLDRLMTEEPDHASHRP